MLDEREEEVPESQLQWAFNRQPLWKRSAIVVAGPLFNLLFAILAYWVIFIVGDTGLKPVVGEVTPQSIAAESGFQAGDELLMIGDRPAKSWETAVFSFAVEAMDGRELPIRVRDASGQERERWIPGEAVAGLAEEPDLLDKLGLEPRRPQLPAVIGELVPGEPAQRAGFEVGDRLLAADGAPIRPGRIGWLWCVSGRGGACCWRSNVEMVRSSGFRSRPSPWRWMARKLDGLGLGFWFPMT